MRTPQRKAKIRATLAELQAELLFCFSQAADYRTRAREYSEQAKQCDKRAQWLREQIDRLQHDLVEIAVNLD